MTKQKEWEGIMSKYAEWWGRRIINKELDEKYPLSFMEAYNAAMFQATSIEFKEAISARVDELIKGPDVILDEAWEATMKPDGFQAYWFEKDGTKTTTKPKFGQLRLSLEKLIDKAPLDKK